VGHVAAAHPHGDDLRAELTAGLTLLLAMPVLGERLTASRIGAVCLGSWACW
jgi:hypothetical protein